MDNLIFIDKQPLMFKGRKFTLHIYQIINPVTKEYYEAQYYVNYDDINIVTDYVKVFIQEDIQIGFIDSFICVSDESRKGLVFKASEFIKNKEL